MSPRTLTMSVKGRRTHGKPSRFDPSEPLHMTTRHAARNGRHNTSSSVSGSNGSDESRRASFDDARPTTSYSLGSQHSTKSGRRLSTTSFNRTSAISQSFETQSTFDDKSEASDHSPSFQPSSPSRKRKRSSPTPPETPNGMPDVDASVGLESTYLDEGDSIEVMPMETLSDRESERSSKTETPSPRDYGALAQSADMTPAASEAVSPVSEQSSLEVVAPGKRPKINLADADQVAEPEDFEEAEDLPDADEGEDADDIDDGDDQVRADAEGRPRRRFAGRRRADHHIPEIEALMRRQSHLKSAFRAITRALKPVLAEIALKTVEELESNPRLHEEVPEYQGVDGLKGIQSKLDAALERRKAQLQAQFNWCRFQLAHTFEAETTVRKDGYRQQLNGFQEARLDQLRHDFLSIARQAQVDDQQSRNETDDEDGDVLLQLKGMGYRFRRKGAVDPRCESRSRVAMDIKQAVGDLQARILMHKLLQDCESIEQPKPSSGFTVMDSTPRDAALMRRESLNNTRLLAEAAIDLERQTAKERRRAEEAERIAKIPVIPNEEVPGLQLLGELALRPSIRATLPPRRTDGFSFLNHATPSQMPPPPLRPPMGAQTPPYEMSPRGPILHERVDPSTMSMPPYQRQQHHPDILNREPPFSPGTSRGFHGSPLSALASNPIHQESPRFGESRGQLQGPPQMPNHHRRHHSDLFIHNTTPPRPAEVPHAAMPGKEESPWDMAPRLPESHSRFRPLYPSPMDRPMHEPLLVVPLTRGDNKFPEAKPMPQFSQQQDLVKPEPPRNQVYLPKTPTWELSGSPRMSDPHREPHMPPSNQERTLMAPNLSLDTAKLPHSRTPSITQPPTDFTSKPNQSIEAPRRQRNKASRPSATVRTNKTERNGFSRKQFKQYSTGSQSKKSPATTDGPSIHRFRLNSIVEPTPQPPPQPPPQQHLPPGSWGGSPPSMPAFPGRPGDFQYPPPPRYGPPAPPPHGVPPPPSTSQYGAYPPEYGAQQHRTNYPPLTEPGPQPWANLPPSPLYAVPRGAQGPPPPPPPPPQPPSSHSGSMQGPSAQSIAPGPGDHPWPPGQQSPFGPPPPRPGDHRTSMPPQPPTTFAPQFGGPAIAPAPPLSDTRFVMGNNPPPAFAQQQRQQDGPSARRRTQSETFSKFQHYSPRGRG